MDMPTVADISVTIYYATGGQRPIDPVTAQWGEYCHQNTTGCCEGTEERKRLLGGGDQIWRGRLSELCLPGRANRRHEGPGGKRKQSVLKNC